MNFTAHERTAISVYIYIYILHMNAIITKCLICLAILPIPTTSYKYENSTPLDLPFPEDLPFSVD